MADTTIGGLTPASSVASTDLVPVFQDGQTLSATVSQVQAASLGYGFVVTQATASLPQSRALIAGNGVNIADLGAGSTVTISLQPNPALTGTQFLGLPSGTTAQRPAGTFGYLRANSDLTALEWYDGSSWSALASATVYVSSVGLSLPAEFSVTGSPVTTTGTLGATWAAAAQNYVFAGPTSGSGTPGFRALVAGDIPSLPYLSSSLTSANILVGNGSNVATAVAMSGDATLANTGAITVSKFGGTSFGSMAGQSSSAVAITGGTATLTAVTVENGATAARSIISADAGVAKIMSWRTAGLPRWAIRVDGAEGGADSGADFALRTYNDSGAYVDSPISIVRAAGGTITVSRPLAATSITIGGAAVATQTYVTSQGYITGNQSITLSGDVSGTGTTAITTTIGANKVTTSMLAQAASNTLLGNNSATTADVSALTDAQVAGIMSRYLELAPQWYR